MRWAINISGSFAIFAGPCKEDEAQIRPYLWQYAGVDKGGWRRTRSTLPWAKISQLDSILLMSLSSKNFTPILPYFWQTRVKQTIVDYKGGWVNRRRTRGKVPWAKIGQLELYNGNNLPPSTSATGFCPQPTLPLQTASYKLGRS